MILNIIINAAAYYYFFYILLFAIPITYIINLKFTFYAIFVINIA